MHLFTVGKQFSDVAVSEQLVDVVEVATAPRIDWSGGTGS
jgi:hypothetical protein